MLKRKNRLSGKIRLQKASSYSTLLYTAKILRNGLLFNRYTVTVSKKIDKRATARNSIKRKLRRFLEENHDIIPLGYDMVFIAKSNIQNADYGDVHKEMKTFFEKIKKPL